MKSDVFLNELSKFENEEIYQYKKLYLTANQSNIESFNLFIEKSLSMLKQGGYLSFILPESILTIGTHKEIRNIILEKYNCMNVNNIEEKNSYELTLDQYERILKIVEE